MSPGLCHNVYSHYLLENNTAVTSSDTSDTADTSYNLLLILLPAGIVDALEIAYMCSWPTTWIAKSQRYANLNIQTFGQIKFRICTIYWRSWRTLPGLCWQMRSSCLLKSSTHFSLLIITSQLRVYSFAQRRKTEKRLRSNRPSYTD